MERPQAGRSFNLAELLRIPFQALVDELHERLALAGFPDIRPTHTIVFALVTAEGIRLSDLAEKAQLTKQLMSYLVDAVEELGYIERVPDPADGRAKLIRLTERGVQASRTGSEIIRAIEHDWASQLGVEDMGSLRALLERLVQNMG